MRPQNKTGLRYNLGSVYIHVTVFAAIIKGADQNVQADSANTEADIRLYFSNIISIMLTGPCNVDPLTSHFYIVKLVFTWVYTFSYFCTKT